MAVWEGQRDQTSRKRGSRQRMGFGNSDLVLPSGQVTRNGQEQIKAKGSMDSKGTDAEV